MLYFSEMTMVDIQLIFRSSKVPNRFPAVNHSRLDTNRARFGVMQKEADYDPSSSEETGQHSRNWGVTFLEAKGVRLVRCLVQS